MSHWFYINAIMKKKVNVKNNVNWLHELTLLDNLKSAAYKDNPESIPVLKVVIIRVLREIEP